MPVGAAAATVPAAQAAGQTVVMCHGCFDIVHPGHVRHLQHAAVAAAAQAGRLGNAVIGAPDLRRGVARLTAAQLNDEPQPLAMAAGL